MTRRLPLTVAFFALASCGEPRIDERYHCAVCDELGALARADSEEEVPCALGICAAECATLCPGLEEAIEDEEAAEAPREADAEVPRVDHFDFRVGKAFGPKGYDLVRITAVTHSAKPPVDGFFDYSEQFHKKWTDKYLHTAVKKVTDLADSFDIGAADPLEVRLPPKGQGVAALLIGDPCYRTPKSKIATVGCLYSSTFRTKINTPALLNAFVPQVDFWGILGDNWYDASGAVTTEINGFMTPKVRQVPFVSVPGNHDFWYFGEPGPLGSSDQHGFGFMQYYGQDTASSAHLPPGSPAAPYNFTAGARGLPGLQNFFFYTQIGNLGLLGFSGAHPWSETKPLVEDACTWFAAQDDIKVLLLLGHWDKNNLGSEDEMDTPDFYHLILKETSCAHSAAAIKFAMGHTHCNIPHPHGNVGKGFMVAGQGMIGCGNYGVPIFDTTDDRIRFWYFPLTLKTIDDVLGCVQAQGWRACTEKADLWLDEPLPEKGAGPRGRAQGTVAPGAAAPPAALVV